MTAEEVDVPVTVTGEDGEQVLRARRPAERYSEHSPWPFTARYR
jgi:hypothetical protein